MLPLRSNVGYLAPCPGRVTRWADSHDSERLQHDGEG
jgi:hypothetical protein